MHDTEDPTRSSAADAAGMAADYSARHTYARGYDDGRKAEKARADAAEQRVAHLSDVTRRFIQAGTNYEEDWREIAAALASTADIAGRWVSREKYDAAQRVVDERDAAIARAEKAEAERDELRRNAGDVREELLDAIEAAADMKANPSETYADAVRRIARARDELAAAQAERDAAVEKAGEADWSHAQTVTELVKIAGQRNDAIDECDALRAEVEAMRGALEKIAGIANRPTGQDWEEIEEARRIALDALRARKVGDR